MILIQEVIAQYYAQKSIQIVKLVIEIIHVLHVSISHFLESFVTNLVRIALEIELVRE